MDDQHTMDGGRQPAAPFKPSEAWIEAFSKQCTDELQLHAQRYAKRRAQHIARAGGHPESDYAHVLVQDVITDTLIGDLKWDHEKPLIQHVLDSIRYRTRHDRKRAQRYRHYRIDAFGTEREPASAPSEYEASLAVDRCDDSPETTRGSSEMLSVLRNEAVGDKHLLAFIDAVIDGARTRAEIMESSKLELKQYRTARERLQRLMIKLDFVEAAPRRA